MSQPPTIKIYPPGHYVELDGDALFLGRDCHLAALMPCLMNKVVSNRHCVIRREGPTRWFLEDLGSTNGTWIHGQRLGGKILLHTGDEFNLGHKGPLVECVTGFGGTGSDRTIPEDEMAAEASAAMTIVESPHEAKTQPIRPEAVPTAPSAPAAPAVPGAGAPRSAAPRLSDGSALHPFRVGKEPTIKLVHQGTGETFTASGYTIAIGRDPAVVQVLIRTDEERHVSGRHAEIQFHADGAVVVRDLESRNGTWLNDKRLKGEAPLKVGDRLLLGNAPTVLLVAEMAI
jgi:pSer/pThr/pTyr-binding forkhead associated (FHA) protein